MRKRDGSLDNLLHDKIVGGFATDIKLLEREAQSFRAYSGMLEVPVSTQSMHLNFFQLSFYSFLSNPQMAL